MTGILSNTGPSCLMMRRVRPSRTTGVRGFVGTCPSAAMITGAGAFAVVKGFFEGLGLSKGGLIITGNSDLALKGRILAFMFTPVIR